MVEADQGDTIDAPFQQRAYNGDFQIEIIAVRCYQHGAVKVAQPGGESLDQLGKNGIVDGRHDQAEGSRDPVVQGAGRAIADITQLVSGFFNAHPCRGTNHIGLAESARNRGDRNPGPGRNLDNTGGAFSGPRIPHGANTTRK